MADEPLEHPKRDAPGNAAKDPAEWTTGDEPMTGAQASYLKTLSQKAGVPFDGALTKAEASRRIDELKRRSPRVSRETESAAGEPGAAGETGEA